MGIHIMTPLYMAAKPPALPPVTVTFYPDKHPEVTSCDGIVSKTTVSGHRTWPELRNGAGSSGSAATLYGSILLLSSTKEPYWFTLYRTILLFDTSSIPPGAIILSAYLRVWGRSQFWIPQWADATVCLVNSFPLSNTDIVAADYQNIGTTLLSNTQPLGTDWVVEGWNTFPLNAAGLAAIDKDGISKFGIREGTWDRPNIEPPWVYNKSSTCSWYSADYLPAHKPELVVIYQP